MKFFTAGFWACILGVFTWTDNLDALMFRQTVHFKWNAHPNFADLLITHDAHITDPFWLFVKTGHFLGFAILELILSKTLGNRKMAAFLTIGYAVFTEILQLYFYRDGRLLDMAIDSSGVLLSFYLQSIPKVRSLLSKNADQSVKR